MYGNKRTLASTVMVITARNIELLATYLNPETNSGIIVGDDSVLIIDSLRVPSFARDLIEDVRHITNKPIKYVVDTHSHWDHAWGNEEFQEAVIIGHENARSEMLDIEAQSEWRAQVTSSGDSWSEEAKSVNITPPNLTFNNSLELHFGTRQIQLLHLGRAHTGGDIFIYLPNEKLLFTGDVAQNKGVPYLGDLDSRLHCPRLDSPRGEVPAGSVAIAETQTGVYPVPSPGGWR